VLGDPDSIQNSIVIQDEKQIQSDNLLKKTNFGDDINIMKIERMITKED
jgi:hypothetical protein